MMATSSELLMRNFNEIFIELDSAKRAALLAGCFTEDCLWIHPGGGIVGRKGINEVSIKPSTTYASNSYWSFAGYGREAGSTSLPIPHAF